MINGWKIDEVEKLLHTVEVFKKQNKPLIDAFFLHAKSFNRKIFSVRNFYYKHIESIKNDKNLQKNIKINLNLHQKNNFAKFDERQTQKLIDYIKGKNSQGISVRKACRELANNNATLMVRYQNKFRQTQQKKQKNLKGSDNQNNLISFPVTKSLPNQKLTDEEIKSLFLGLVNLVKKSTFTELNEQLLKEKQTYDTFAKQSVVKIMEKDKQIDELLTENKKLTSKIVSLKTKLENLRASTIENI